MKTKNLLWVVVSISLSFPIFANNISNPSNNTATTEVEVQKRMQNSNGVSSILNNPFLEKRVESLLKKTIDRITQEKIKEIREKDKLKYEAQILQLKLKNLELQKKIAQLQIEVKRLKEELKGKLAKKRREIPKIEVVGITQVGNYIELKTKDGTIITKGSVIDNEYVVLDIKPQEKVLIVKDKDTGKIVRIHYILNL